MPSRAKGSPSKASCSHCNFCTAPIGPRDFGSDCRKLCGRPRRASPSRASTSTFTTSRISSASRASFCSPLSARLSCGKYVRRKVERPPSPDGLAALVSRVPEVSWRQMGHDEMRYSPGWKAIGPSTKHFQQKACAQLSSTTSVTLSRQMGHIRGSRAVSSTAASSELGGASSKRTSTFPSDSIAAWSSAKSAPLKNVCRESQPARSPAMSSRPNLVRFLRFLRILTTATAFHTAYMRSWSTSWRTSTRRRRRLPTLASASEPTSCRDAVPSAAFLPRLSSEARLAIKFISPCCFSAKQVFTCRISAARASSKTMFASSASPRPVVRTFSATSLMSFFNTL
mmetsp:Transcript_11729/g.30102  ORF Transcript_11729/g.30102 Transcript_11729/m.30102 type:complete len:341 (-) Transcript_11729:157-1179(-)